MGFHGSRVLCEGIHTSEMNGGFACARVNAALLTCYICVSRKKAATDTSCSRRTVHNMKDKFIQHKLCSTAASTLFCNGYKRRLTQGRGRGWLGWPCLCSQALFSYSLNLLLALLKQHLSVPPVLGAGQEFRSPQPLQLGAASCICRAPSWFLQALLSGSSHVPFHEIPKQWWGRFFHIFYTVP